MVMRRKDGRRRADRGTPRSDIGREAKRLGVTYHCIYWRLHPERHPSNKEVRK